MPVNYTNKVFDIIIDLTDSEKFQLYIVVQMTTREGDFYANNFRQNISISTEYQMTSKAPLDSRGFFILKYIFFFSILITSLAYGSKKEYIFLNPAFS